MAYSESNLQLVLTYFDYLQGIYKRPNNQITGTCLITNLQRQPFLCFHQIAFVYPSNSLCVFIK